MGKFRTTYWQVSALRALWTILGILALAFLMTPRFVPFGSNGDTEISQTVSDSPSTTKSKIKKSNKHQNKKSAWHQIQKLLQVRSNAAPTHSQASRL